MIALIFLILILAVAAYFAPQLLPHPLGVIAAVVLGLLALYLIVTGVVDGSGNVGR